MGKIELHGKNLSKTEKDEATEFITYRHREAKDSVGGEYEKSEEDCRIISALNGYVQEELQALGLVDIGEISPDQIHLFPGATYKQKFPDVDVSAFHEAFSKAIYIDADDAETVGKLQFIRDLLHEMIHIASKTKYHLEGDDLRVTRSGYRSINPTKEHDHLWGLNEAVVEKIVLDILERHRLEIVRDFDISLEDYAKEGKYFSIYQEHIKILEDVIKEISLKKGEDIDNVWRRFKRGIFTGEMMHLRDIKKVYGKNALRIIDMLGQSK